MTFRPGRGSADTSLTGSYRPPLCGGTETCAQGACVRLPSQEVKPLPWLPRIPGMVSFDMLIDDLEREKQALVQDTARRGPASYAVIDMLITLDLKIFALRTLSEDR
ncbi:hypothetical protein [Methylobacterium sp. Leaf106]|uniref:hypothetical protein n=1 Tax=Methylobacterium sp. Leaf106 TaxID=1736255 RepID=UPI00138F723C|nr:hypothetical protein [Methylobacterium sp. Leaf106]